MLTVNETSFKDSISSKKSCVYMFSSPWCQPCRHLKPTVLKLEADPSFSDIKFYNIDCDENSEIAGRFNISAVPTLVFWNGEKETGRLPGVSSEVKIRQELSRI